MWRSPGRVHRLRERVQVVSDGKLAVLTSGGDAPGMNAAIRSVVRCGLAAGFDVVGVERGYYGLMRGDFVEFSPRTIDDIVHRGGTVLKSARADEFRTEEGRERALAHLRRAGITGLVAIGGDGTLRGALHLAKAGIPTIGIPGTIDNDIPCTDMSIGFDTAVNTVLNAVNHIRDTAVSHERVYVVEVMGRNSGYIALYAGLAAGAEAILIPEQPVDLVALCRRLERAQAMGKTHSIIIVAEGVGGDPVSGRTSDESAAFRVASEIHRITANETRVTVLGHLQRGGSPTAADRILANRFGEAAVRLLAQGHSGRMVGVQGNRIVDMPIEEALNMTRPIDEAYYDLADRLSAM